MSPSRSTGRGRSKSPSAMAATEVAHRRSCPQCPDSSKLGSRSSSSEEEAVPRTRTPQCKARRLAPRPRTDAFHRLLPVGGRPRPASVPPGAPKSTERLPFRYHSEERTIRAGAVRASSSGGPSTPRMGRTMFRPNSWVSPEPSRAASCSGRVLPKRHPSAHEPKSASGVRPQHRDAREPRNPKVLRLLLSGQAARRSTWC